MGVLVGLRGLLENLEALEDVCDSGIEQASDTCPADLPSAAEVAQGLKSSCHVGTEGQGVRVLVAE